VGSFKLFGKVAGFEFRYQTRQPVFWVSGAIFLLLSYIIMAVPNVQIGSGGNVLRNAPVAIAMIHLSFGIYFMFASTAFVANGVVRDDDTGFGPLIRTTGVDKASYLFGRFFGAFAAVALCFLVVPIGILAGVHSPWNDAETIGPDNLYAYLYSYAFLVLPTLFTAAAILFAIASATRSMMASYIGVIVLFIVTIAVAAMLRKPEWRILGSLLDPFGSTAFSYTVSYWTASERNGSLPPIGGVLLYNRLIWIGVSLAVLAVCYALFRFGEPGSKARKAQASLPASSPLPGEGTPIHRLPQPRFNARTTWAQFVVRTRHEVRQIFRSVAFYVLILVGLLFGAIMLWMGSELYGTTTLPVTRSVIELLDVFSIAPLIIAIFYAGELVWRDREKNAHALVDAMPFPDWTFLAPKIIALSLVLWTSLLVSLPLGILYQLSRGYTHIALDEYLLWYLLPQAGGLVLLATWAVVIQVFSPHKFVGWAVVLLVQLIFAGLALLGWSHRLYIIRSVPGVPLSDMNGQGQFWLYALWFRLYWTAFMLVLAVAAHVLWRRGVAVSFKARLAQAPARLKGGAGVIGALALVAFIGLGGFIFYNTNVLNVYRTGKAQERLLVDYEKTLLKYEYTPQPTVTAVKLDLDLHPHQHRLVAKGEFTLVNKTAAPLTEVHVRIPDQDMPPPVIAIDGAVLSRDWPKFGYRIYRFTTPLQPGQARQMTFTTLTEQRGFTGSGGSTRLVDNGTFISNSEFEPAIGMSRDGLMQNRSKRRKYGLPADLRMAKLTDPRAMQKNYLPGGDWVTSDITITTDADQTPIAPGYTVSDTTAGGRRTIRFVSDTPIIHFFSVQSARYKIKRETYKGVDLAVYYHPTHAMNVDRMIKAMKVGLDYDQANFGPYQFRQARVVEFPAYATYAQSFANTMAYSESIGFIADNRDPEKIDYVTYVTAHELAHQWWAHQIIGANMQGATSLSETLAQYSALMAMEKLYGQDSIRRFLKYELDQYLLTRRSDPLGESTLDRVESGQTYIHYQKGGLVLYLLRNELGEDKVNAALRSLLDQYRFKGAPYPRSLDLVAALRAQARPDQQNLITDLMDKITLYDLRIENSKATKRADGRYDVTVSVQAKKLYATDKGKETEAPLNETFDIGLFAREPGLAAFNAKDVILLERRPLHSGLQSFTFVTTRRPDFVGVDPYNKWIDRDSEDNVLKTGLKAGEGPRKVNMSAAMRASGSSAN
jgi:ABC-2 type transport system permease protein